jgi:hypothetical protein
MKGDNIPFSWKEHPLSAQAEDFQVSYSRSHLNNQELMFSLVGNLTERKWVKIKGARVTVEIFCHPSPGRWQPQS